MFAIHRIAHHRAGLPSMASPGVISETERSSIELNLDSAAFMAPAPKGANPGDGVKKKGHDSCPFYPGSVATIVASNR